MVAGFELWNPSPQGPFLAVCAADNPKSNDNGRRADSSTPVRNVSHLCTCFIASASLWGFCLRSPISWLRLCCAENTFPVSGSDLGTCPRKYIHPFNRVFGFMRFLWGRSWLSYRSLRPYERNGQKDPCLFQPRPLQDKAWRS